MELCSDHFLAGKRQPRVLNKDHTVWLVGAKYIIFQSDNIFSGLADFLSGIDLMHIMESSTKIYISKYKKISKTEAMLRSFF